MKESASFYSLVSQKNIFPIQGSMLILFNGTYTPNDITNDFSYFYYEGAEDNNYNGYIVKNGDVLSFWTYTDYYTTPASIVALPCGIEIDFTDGTSLREVPGHKDQNGIYNSYGNYNSVSKWYQRNLSISDMSGKTIREGIRLVQENDQSLGTRFTCLFDGIRIGPPLQ